MVYSKIAFREIRKRPGRAILTLLSIVIGVAAVVAVSISSGTASRAFDEIYQTIAGKATLEISPPVGTSFDETITDAVRGIPGVKEVAPIIQRRIIMYVGDHRVQAIAMGIDPVRDHAVHDYEITAGQSLEENPKGVILDVNFAKGLGLNAGDKFEMQTPKTRVNTEVIGLYASKGTATTGQGAVLLMPLRAAQYLFKTPKKIDSAQIVLDPDTSEKRVSAAITKVLPTGIGVHRPAAQPDGRRDLTLDGAGHANGPRVFDPGGAFHYYQHVSDQRHAATAAIGDYAGDRGNKEPNRRDDLHRSNHDGRGWNRVGFAFGRCRAHLLNLGMGAPYKATLPPIQLTVTPFLLAIAFGVGMSLLAAALPARKASNLSPLEAMREVTHDEIAGVSRWLVLMGLALVVICGGVMAASIWGDVSNIAVVWMAVGLLIGIVLMLPIALGPLSKLVAAAPRPMARIEGRLARLQLLRHRSRTTLTVGVVFIAISTGIGLASSIIDNVTNVQNWYHKAFTADFFVRAMVPDMASGLMADLPDTIGSQIRKIPGITNIDTARLVSAKAAGQQVVLIARGYNDPQKPPLDIISGNLDNVRQQLLDGETVIGSVLAERAGLKVGDNISFETEDGTKEFHIAAIANDYQAGGLTMYLASDVARNVLGVEGVDVYILQVDHARIAEVRQELEKLCQDNGVLLQSATDIQKSIDGMISGVVACLWAMVVLALLVAAFGVANTLTMNVLEQTREIGLLRILAMTRAQVRKTIFSQAMMIALLALVPGLAAGIFIAYLINAATLHVIGHPVAFKLHLDLLIGTFIAGLIVVGAAAWFPANRAAKLNLQTALSFR